MNLKQQLLIVISTGLLAAGCDSGNYKKTSQGMAYKIFSEGKGEKIKPGMFVKLNFSNEIEDSVIYSTFDHIPGYGRYDSVVTPTYDFVDFLGEMHVGDSAVFNRSVDTLVNKGMAMYGGKFKKGGTVKGYLKILDVFTSQSDVAADQEKAIQNEIDRESAELEKYLKEKNITNAKKTPEGVFVLVEKEGTGPAADSGKYVTVNYTGSFKNGKKFDSNLDTSFHHVSPLSFTVGAREVIEGWDFGFPYFKEGGAGKLFVPAMLAYGPQGRGADMPPYSDLIFDVEVLKVENNPTGGNMPPTSAVPGEN